MFFLKQNDKNVFSDLIDKYTPDIKTDLAQPNTDNPLEIKEIAYILISIKEDDNQLKNIKDIVIFLEENSVMVEIIEPVFIKGSIGALPFDTKKNKSEEIQKVINNLSSSNFSFQSCVYGIQNCRYGNIGSNNRMNFTVIIPNYQSVLNTLFSLNSKEIKSV